MMETIAFGVLAAALVVSGAFAVNSRHLVHSVLWLACTLLATAGIYVTLEAPFIAGIQVILYTGGIITLMLFGVMLTEKNLSVGRENPSHRRPVGVLIAGIVFGLLAAAMFRSPLPLTPKGNPGATIEIGASFLGPHVLALEVLSILLLAAVVGAIVLARRSDP